MKVAIYSRVFNKENSKDIQLVFDLLNESEISYITEELFFAQCIASGLKSKTSGTFSSQEEIKEFSPDFFIILGGDGTILDSITFMGNNPVPVLGINKGRLGFLAGESASDIKNAIGNLLKGHYSIDNRSVLQLDSSNGLFKNANYGLNDFVIHKKDSSSMITIHVYTNGEYLNSYWSDGLIISTPTGSTGYSLSCGGPILYPGSSSFVITPIAPHNLNVRPMVISDKNVLSFEIEGRSTSFLISLDSRSEAIEPNVQLAVKKAPFKFELIRFKEDTYLKTLRRKLMWGLDNRNL
ncbi:MAG: NAD kinase [Bacteroidia bacterium]